MWQPCLKFVEGSPRRRCTWLGSQAGVAHAGVAVRAPAVRRARARRRRGSRCPVPQHLPDWRSASFLQSLPPFRLASCLVGTITRSHRLVFLPSVSFLGRLLHFYHSALSKSRIASRSCGSRVPDGFSCYKAPSESPGRCLLSSSPCVFSAAGATPSVPVRTPVCLRRPVHLPLPGSIPALLPTRRLSAPLGWLSSFPGRKSLSVSLSPSRHDHADVCSPSLSFTSLSPSGGRGLRLFNLCSRRQTPGGVEALDVC